MPAGGVQLGRFPISCACSPQQLDRIMQPTDDCASFVPTTGDDSDQNPFFPFYFFILPPISNMTSSLFLTESSDSRLHTLHSHVGHLLLSLTFLFIPSTRRIPPGVGGTATQEFLPIKTSICQLQFSCVQFRFALDVHVSLHRLLSPPGLAPVDDKNYVSISDSFTVVEFVEKMTSISIVNGNSRGS